MFLDIGSGILNPGAQISKAWAEYMPPGAQYWGPQGLDFLTMLTLRAGPAK